MIGGIGHAGLRQEGVGDTRVESRLEVAGDTPAEQFSGIGDDDRRGNRSAPITTRAKLRQLGSIMHRANGMGELARLAASLDIAPARGCRDIAGTRIVFDASRQTAARSAAHPRMKSSIATTRAPACSYVPIRQRQRQERRKWRPSPADGSAWLKRTTDRAAIANRAIGDVAERHPAPRRG